METIRATVPVTRPPSWAVQQRHLMAAMKEGVHPFVDRYVRDNGEFIWDDAWGGGSPDDYYEPYFNWPLLYLMGGGSHLIDLARCGWEGVTRQLTRCGTVHDEYHKAEDVFHISESDVFFYHLCLADPANGSLRLRARKFAGFYTGDDPEVRNYDPEKRIILSPVNGSGGPSYRDDSQRDSLHRGSERYGIPFYDLPGISSWRDTEEDAKALEMGRAAHDRWARGDVIHNLAQTTLATNAFLLTGEERYRDWAVEYAGAWMERARANDWMVPDNVGHSGAVGEYIDGKWYGGQYGWTFPHGWYNIQMALLAAAGNALLLTGDDAYLELPRRQQDRIFELGEQRDARGELMSLDHHWFGQFTAMGERGETFLVPYRYGDAGWFDWQPLSPVFPAALWNLSMEEGDWERIEQVRTREAYDWREVICFHNKEDSGHEQPWLRFLAGDNPDYPERILQAAHQEVTRRLALVRGETEVGTRHNIHLWQEVNPVSSEALIQQTLGAPQPIYNGGLLHARLRYYDARARGPGLPPDVAALVTKLEAGRTVVRLVNLNSNAGRELVIQAGAYGEHRFSGAQYTALDSDYPGPATDYAGQPVTEETRTADFTGRYLGVELPPGTEITIDLATDRYAGQPSCASLY